MKNINRKIERKEVLTDLRDRENFKKEIKKRTIEFGLTQFKDVLSQLKKEFPRVYIRTRTVDDWNVLCEQDENYQGKIELGGYRNTEKGIEVLCDTEKAYDFFLAYKNQNNFNCNY